MPPLTDSEFLLISKSDFNKLQNFADGAQLARRSRRTIKQLQALVAKDRLTLAKLHLKDATAVLKCSPSMNRAVVSRAYYALYHAARAASYISFGGDDYEQHTTLPTKFPVDFPDSAVWRNRLKDARLERNRADYDPYPVGDADFSATAVRLVGEAKQFIKLTQSYLKLKST